MIFKALSLPTLANTIPIDEVIRKQPLTKSKRISRPPRNLTVMATQTQPSLESLTERKEFDDSKAGVKGLVDKGLTTIPRFFVHPQESLIDLTLEPTYHAGESIPTVDLSKLNIQRSRVVEEVSRACREVGFFQVVNHGIPVDVIDRTITAIKRFNEQRTEEKAKWYTRDTSSGVAYSSNFDLFFNKAASWRDTLQMKLSPVLPDPENIPEVCRNEIIEWDGEVKQLAEILMELLSKGLGVDSGRLKELSCLEARVMAAHYYPYCPQPHLTFGGVSHTDPGVLTLLIQDQVGGLQVKVDGTWLDVKPIPGAIVINVGDLLQIISNGQYRSSDHRVLANSSKEARVSIAIFCSPSKRDILYGPLPELVTPEKPAVYRQFDVTDFMTRFFSKDLGDKTLVNFYKLPDRD